LKQVVASGFQAPFRLDDDNRVSWTPLFFK
jgi:hypothetical protein